MTYCTTPDVVLVPDQVLTGNNLCLEFFREIQEKLYRLRISQSAHAYSFVGRNAQKKFLHWYLQLFSAQRARHFWDGHNLIWNVVGRQIGAQLGANPVFQFIIQFNSWP